MELMPKMNYEKHEFIKKNAKMFGLYCEKRKLAKDMIFAFVFAHFFVVLMILSKLIFTETKGLLSIFTNIEITIAFPLYLFYCIFQEVLARGIGQRIIKESIKSKYNGVLANIVISILFSLLHFHYYNILMIILSFFLSIVIGVIYEKQGHVLGCTFFHWIIGAWGIALFFN